jgi:8-oxo-dGTP pyrophosphatase MutT (NUDIX family)
MMKIQNLTEEKIRQKLEENYPSPGNLLYPAVTQVEGFQPSAVLLPLFQTNGSWHLLFIRRTAVSGDAHSGQVAFPGGRPAPGEARPEVTALRETQEEIGLNPQEVGIIGYLKQTHTMTNYIIFPVVGIIPYPHQLHPSPIEVCRVFTIPLEWLAEPCNYDQNYYTLPATNIKIPVIYFKPYDGEILWGASARITIDFLETLQII